MTIPQTTVKSALRFASEGQRFPTDGEFVDAFTAVAAATIPPGVFVIPGTDPATEVNVLAGTETSWENLLGVSELDSLRSSVNYSADEVVPVVRRGRIAVKSIAASLVSDIVHVYKSGANKGFFDVASQGVAQVTTVTPTATNDALYGLHIVFTAGPAVGEQFDLFYQADASATATEICDGFRAALNADARLAALITETGTATLILTATDKESIFTVADHDLAGATSIVATTAGAPTTLALPKERARILRAAAAGFPAMLEIRL